MSKGKRYEGENKLNIKKVIGLLIALAVIIMFIFSLQHLLKKDNPKPSKDITAEYFAVYTDSKWGVINSLGETVIEPTYTEMIIVPDKEKALFICTYDLDPQKGTYKIKVINEKNETILTQYESVEPIDNYDQNKNVWYEKNVVRVKKEGKYGLANLEGKEILSPEYDKIESVKGITNSLLLIKGEKRGLANNLGEIVIEPQYEEIKALGQKYETGYIVKNKEKQYGIIDANKKTILEPKYEDIKQLSANDMYIVKTDGKWKVINKKEETVLESGFDDITQINLENIITKKDNKYGAVDKEGKKILDNTYQYLSYAFDDYYIAEKDNKYGIINANGETKLEFKFKNLTYRQDAGFLEAEDEEYNTIIYDRNLEEKLTGILTEVNIEMGYIRARVDNEYKYYNFKFEEKKNTEILPQRSLYLDKKDGKYGYIDKNGTVVVEYIYDDATEQNKYGYSAVKQENVWGSIDKMGKVVQTPDINLDNNLVIDFIGKWHLGAELNLNYYTDQK